jgi:hypothetical protein
MTSASESRVTRSRRSLTRAVALGAAGLVLVGALQAQEGPRDAQPAPAAQPGGASPSDTAATASAPAPAASPAAPTAPPADGKAAPQGATGPAPAAGGRSPERFEPTEKVRADFDVSFPVDI